MDSQAELVSSTTSTDTAAATFFNELPLLPEIWLDILTYLSYPGDIKNASLACQSLRQMAQPLLFRYLKFRPYDNLQTSSSSKELVPWALQKIDFCSSNQSIASAVRRVDIHVPFLDIEDQDQHNLILNSIFKQLPKLVSLATVVCRCVLCTSHHLKHLSELGRLGRLELTDCSLDIPADRSITLRVSSLEISSLQLFPIDEWLSYFRADSVSIAIGDQFRNILPDLATSPSIIQRLQSLHTTIQRGTLPLLAKVLSHRPPLKSLRLRSTEIITKSDFRALSFTPPPLLDTYWGPYELIYALSTKSLHDLRHVKLSSSSVDGLDNPIDIQLAILSWEELAMRLETLQFSVRYLTEDLLKTVINHCSKLKKLTIAADNRSLVNLDAYTSQDLISALRTLNLPSQIEHLSIEYRTRQLVDDWAHDDPTLLDYLALRYSTLRSITFIGTSPVMWNREDGAG